MHEHLERQLVVHPEEIDAIVFTHLHWDHVQNMKMVPNARSIAPKAEIEMACNPLPPYWSMSRKSGKRFCATRHAISNS